MKFGAMGDMVMLTSMVKALSARYGSAVDVLSSGPWTKPLMSGLPGAGTVYLLKNRSRLLFFTAEQRRVVQALRQRGAGPTWYCDTSGKCLHVLHRAGIGADMIRKATDLPMHAGEHLVDYWQRLVRRAPVGAPAASVEDAPACDPELVVSAAEAQDLDRWLASRGLAGRQLLLVQAGNKRTMRRGLRRRPSNTKWWPEDRWAAVIQAIARMHPQAAILMLGVPQEHSLNQQVIGLAGLPVVNVAGDLPMPRLLALQSRASAMVSVDTGPAHSAAALGCPVLVLFGVADPNRNLPRGAGTTVRHLVGRDGSRPSILGITVEQVVAEWRELPKR